ncbi:MAG: 2,3-bisphosphoglycerate-independent phosphoglycerate mutase [Caldilineaceae bacterium]
MRTNAETRAHEEKTGVPYSTGYGEPEPEFVGRQPNRYPDQSAPDAHFVEQSDRWAPDIAEGQPHGRQESGGQQSQHASNHQSAETTAMAHQGGLSIELLQRLRKPSQSKIVLLVMDGLGGLPQRVGGKTELETANTPHLDELATHGICGLQQPVATGITSGSGPGHLALFGYEPLTYQIGRGVLSALGIDFDLQPQDVAARGNFCTVDEEGLVTDRRAGRISSEKGKELCALLDEIELPGVELFVRPVEEYRFLLVLRGARLNAALTDTDPQRTGAEPLPPRATQVEAEPTADFVRQFLEAAQSRLADRHPANMVLLRGFAQRPDWPTISDAFGLHAAAIAAYPMYRGVARLLGMEPLRTAEEPAAKIDLLTKRWQDFDFFFVHVKRTDSAGEDGDFDRKVALIEEVDAQIPRLLDLKPDVVLVTGDHSTPAVLQAHSWHPVPVLLWSTHCRPDQVTSFGERPCIHGALGPRFPAAELMPLASANARRLEKFGA